jgi:hypothetical protein
LLAVLRAEQVIIRCHVRTGGWVRGAKWFTLGATYVMNSWSAYATGTAALVVLHSVPPLVVFVATEAITTLRYKLTEAASAATEEPVNGVSDENSRPVMTTEIQPAPRKRPSFEEYLAIARQAWQPGTDITPIWSREVTGCSRGLSSRLASELRKIVEKEAQS